MRPLEVGIDTIDRIGDDGHLLGIEHAVRRRDEIGDQRLAEAPVGGRIFELQRRKAGRLARRQPLVAPAHGAHEDLAAAVLVDEDAARARLDAHALGEQKGEGDGLARASRTDCGEVPDICLVKIEEVGRLAGGLQQ